MRQGWKQVALAIVVFAGTAGHEAVAAVCFPYAGGVPGATGSGPPDWWSSGATMTGSATREWVEDPRWRGAFGDMGKGMETFRVLVENTGGVQYLVMYWEIKSDATGAGDKLYFGVWDDTSSTGNIFRLTRNAAAETTEAGVPFDAGGGASAFTGQLWGGSGTLGSVAWAAPAAGSALPAWMMSYTRVDVDCTTPPSGGCDTWAIRIRARIDPAANTADATPSGIKISTGTPRSFRFWYEIQDNVSTGFATYTFPAGLTTHANETGPTFPDPTDWKQAQLGTGASCDGDILFNSGDVYVGSTVGATQLDFTSNTFHATPTHNAPGVNISNSELTARFRIANWGSAGFNSPEWKDTCIASGSGTNVTYGNDFARECTWSVPDACPYRPAGHACGGAAGSKDRHQCILVDLGQAGTRQYTFSVQSVFRNMDFDVNSRLVRQATIDIKGNGQMPGGAANRDVYLYVHTRNLPEKIETRSGDNTLSPRLRFKELQLPATGAIGTQESARIQAALLARKMTWDQVEQIMPTYIVYVWHDTGRTLPTPTGPKQILEAQPPFGLFLAHDGAIEGWKHQLTAAGAVLVGPNLYKVSAPNDSTFPVTITIEPIEPGDGGPGGVPPWVWILLLLLLLLMLYGVFRLLRKKHP